MSDSKKVMQDMLANAVHFGHKTSKWNPKMSPYLHSSRNGVHIFDLNKTYKGLQAATDFITTAVGQNKNILLVSTKQQAAPIIKEVAEKTDMPYVINKWIPGLLTNFKTIRSRVNHLKKLKDEQESGEFEKYTKKEAGKFKKQIDKLETALGGVVNLEKTPNLVFIVDAVRDRIAVKEAKKIGATVIAIVDSNADPRDVDFPIPGNDDAIKSIRFFLDIIAESIQKAKKKN